MPSKDGLKWLRNGQSTTTPSTSAMPLCLLSLGHAKLSDAPKQLDVLSCLRKETIEALGGVGKAWPREEESWRMEYASKQQHLGAGRLVAALSES